MLRALVVLLLLANGLFFAWSRGWLAPAFPPPHASQREPERIAAQLHPEAVIVLPAKAASAAISAARAAAMVCLEAGPLSEADVAAAEAVLTGAQLPDGSWLREAAPPPLWLVYLGRAADAAGQRARTEEVRKFNPAFELLDAPAELANGFVLSRHATKVQAEAALAAASMPALKAARLVNLPVPPVKLLLKIPQADVELQDRLKALPTEALAGGFKPCTTRP